MSDTSAAGLLATSGASMKVTNVDLRSCFLAIPPTVPRFTVGPDGVIDDAPGRFWAAKDEVVTWAITNASSKPITVRLVNFLRRRHPTDPHGQDPAATHFVWLGRNDLTLEDRQTDFLYARIARPAVQRMGDSISYTIEVRSTDGTSFAIDYDPDGDIKP